MFTSGGVKEEGAPPKIIKIKFNHTPSGREGTLRATCEFNYELSGNSWDFTTEDLFQWCSTVHCSI